MRSMQGCRSEAKVDEVPLDALALVLLLLQDEHGVVEELLQLLIGVVDAQLLEDEFMRKWGGRREEEEERTSQLVLRMFSKEL